MADFKFFGNNEDDAFERLFDEAERLEADNELLRRYDPELHGPLDATVFVSLNRNRDTFSNEEYTHLLRQQRQLLIERMWEMGQISHIIVSQDENGFTLRTEILNF